MNAPKRPRSYTERKAMSSEFDFIVRIVIAVLAGVGWGILLAHYTTHGSILP